MYSIQLNLSVYEHSMAEREHCTAERLMRWSVDRLSRVFFQAWAKHQHWKPSFNSREFSHLHKRLCCIITPENIVLLNCEIYQRGRVPRPADTELVLLISRIIRLPGSILGVIWVRRKQTNIHLISIKISFIYSIRRHKPPWHSEIQMFENNSEN